MHADCFRYLILIQASGFACNRYTRTNQAFYIFVIHLPNLSRLRALRIIVYKILLTRRGVRVII